MFFSFDNIIFFNNFTYVFRDVSNAKGSLCSIAFMYLALTDTIQSKTEMKNLSYDTMKETMIDEIMKIKNLNSSNYDASQNDETHMRVFKQGNRYFKENR